MQVNSQNFNNKLQPNNTPTHKIYFATRKEIQSDRFEKSNSKKDVTFAGLHSEISKISKPLNEFLTSFIPDKPKTLANEITNIEEIQRITQGELGRIRSAEELSPVDVLKVMRNQLKPYSTQEIEGILDTFKPEYRELALKTLQKMSQYGNLQSLKHLAESLSSLNKQTGSEILVGRVTNITAILEYLQRKGSFSSNVQISKVGTEVLKDNTILVLDENLLKRLETDKSLVDLIKSKKNITIAYPEGWLNGNNPFNHSTVQEIQQRATIIVEDAKKIKNDTGFSDNEAIDKALNSSILETINKLGLTDNLKILKNSSKVANPNAEHIAELLSPLQMSEGEMLEQMEQILPKYRQAALEILSRESRVFSMRTLNEIAKKQQQNILKIAERKGIPEENIYYYVPDCYKSYGIVTMQHQIVNNIPNEKIITEWHKLNELKEIEKSMVVVLDDVAASGKNLRDDYSAIKQTYEYNGELVIAPTISTIKAKGIFESIAETNNKLTYLPGETITSFNDNTYFLSLPDDQKILMEKVMGEKGWNDDNFNIAFPYMSPDNNNAMFATLFAPKLLLGGKEAAKRYSWQYLLENIP